MKYIHALRFSLLCSLVLFLLMGCGSSAPAASATSTPGIGVPVSAGTWEVTVSNVYQANEWSGNKPKSGYTLLVLDATFHNLDSAQTTRIIGNAIAIIENDGKITDALGWGIPDDSHIDIMEIGDMKKNPSEAGITGGLGFVPAFESKGDTLKATYVFILTEDSISLPLKFQFQDVQIPFSLSQ